jgi:hypothetical protein
LLLEADIWLVPFLLPAVLALWAFVLRSTAHVVEATVSKTATVEQAPAPEVVEVKFTDPLPHSGNGSGEQIVEPSPSSQG